jgi:hypothetical protein
VALAQELDGSLREHRFYYQVAVSLQSWKRPTTTPGAATAAASFTTLQAVVLKTMTSTHLRPMNLSVEEIRRGMSSQKRVKRLAKGRCFGCGG